MNYGVRPPFLWINNGDFESAVDSTGHGSAVAGQGRADEQGPAGDGCLGITRAVASGVIPAVVAAAEIGQRIAGSSGAPVNEDCEGLSRNGLNRQVGRGLRRAPDNSFRAKIWRSTRSAYRKYLVAIIFAPSWPVGWR